MSWLSRAIDVVREISAGVDAGNALRHGLPVSEATRRRCAHHEGRVDAAELLTCAGIAQRTEESVPPEEPAAKVA